MKEKKVLIVEDTPHLQIFVKKIFERNGFSVLEAANGLEALRALQMNEDIELVLLDIMMPKMDGLEFLNRISDYKSEKGFRICAMTAKETPREIKEILRHGADDYIVKPIDDMILIDKAKILLKQKDVNEFCNVKCDYSGFVDTPDGMINVVIETLSENCLSFTSPVMIPENARVFMYSEKIQEVLSSKLPFILRIYQAEKKGSEFLIRGTFVALKDEEYKRLRSITTRGE